MDNQIVQFEHPALGALAYEMGESTRLLSRRHGWREIPVANMYDGDLDTLEYAGDDENGRHYNVERQYTPEEVAEATTDLGIMRELNK